LDQAEPLEKQDLLKDEQQNEEFFDEDFVK
jgi:hypothetical protein